MLRRPAMSPLIIVMIVLVLRMGYFSNFRPNKKSGVAFFLSVILLVNFGD